MKNFEELFAELSRKAVERPEGSGTVAELDAGIHAIGKKIIEEAGEVWIAAEYESDEQVALEASPAPLPPPGHADREGHRPRRRLPLPLRKNPCCELPSRTRDPCPNPLPLF